MDLPILCDASAQTVISVCCNHLAMEQVRQKVNRDEIFRIMDKETLKEFEGICEDITTLMHEAAGAAEAGRWRTPQWLALAATWLVVSASREG